MKREKCALCQKDIVLSVRYPALHRIKGQPYHDICARILFFLKDSSAARKSILEFIKKEEGGEDGNVTPEKS